ncbi:kinase-like domain-containing protein [Cyathus striatus]|nr:kinase-like domain-containing protein [Cyathus striatus]
MTVTASSTSSASDPTARYGSLRPPERFASMKVLSADASAESSELTISRHLQQQQEKRDSHPGKEHVIRIFVIKGPIGTHHCIFTEILGISLDEHVEDYYGKSCDYFPPRVAKRLATQAALGVAYLHKCGIFHGDLHLGNLLFYSSELQKASHTMLTEIYGEPYIQPITYWDEADPVSPSINRPTTIVHHAQRLYSLMKICLLTIHIKICDFVESSFHNSLHHSSTPLRPNMPIVFRAPEIIFGDIDYPAPSMDIWALGVLMHMILDKSHVPFDSFCSRESDTILLMVMCLGKLPEKWWNAWGERAEYFDENSIDRETNELMPAIDIGIIEQKGFSAKEVNAFRDVAYKIFRYAPEERIDAEKVARLLPVGWRHGKIPRVLKKGAMRREIKGW